MIKYVHHWGVLASTLFVRLPLGLGPASLFAATVCKLKIEEELKILVLDEPETDVWGKKFSSWPSGKGKLKEVRASGTSGENASRKPLRWGVEGNSEERRARQAGMGRPGALPAGRIRSPRSTAGSAATINGFHQTNLFG